MNGDICSVCCGTERENTVRCPFSCVYLQEARQHERPAPLDRAAVPNQDIVVRESFLEKHADEITVVTGILGRSAFAEPDTTDSDVRETLEALIRTYRTRQSGLYYDSRPENAVAARIFTGFQQGMEEYQKDLQKNGGRSPSDSDLVTILVFLQRIELDRNNGRKLCRAFLQFVQQVTEMPVQQTSPLIYTV